MACTCHRDTKIPLLELLFIKAQRDITEEKGGMHRMRDRDVRAQEIKIIRGKGEAFQKLKDLQLIESGV